MKAWRNNKYAGQSYTVTRRALRVDSEGFLPDRLDPDEVAKISKVPGWRFMDRDGVEAIGDRLIDAVRARDMHAKRVETLWIQLDAAQKGLADCEERILQLRTSETEAEQRAREEREAAQQINVEKLSFHELRAVAARLNIDTSQDKLTRDTLAAAVRAVLAATTAPPQADAVAAGT